MADDLRQKSDLSALRINRENDRESAGGKKSLRTILWVGIPLLAIIILWVIISNISPSVEVKTATATTLTQSQSQSVLSATGYVVAQHQAAVASKATGRLEYLNVEEGDKVLKGQVIGQLENDDITAALDVAKAGLEQARANSTATALNYNRAQGLIAAGSITQADYENAQAAYLSNSAAVSSAIANVKAAQVALENTYIRAPFDGTVLTKYADVGEIVAPFGSSGNTRGAVVDLADMRTLEAEADVAESNIEQVKASQPCEIILDAYPEVRYKGQVKKIVPTADRTRATVMVKVAFDQLDDRVLPEMSARVDFLENNITSQDSSGAPTTIIPNTALVSNGDRQSVFTIIDNKARGIDVVTGKKFGNLTEITEGIKPGQTVIISPPSNLKSGDKIKIAE